MSRTRTPEEEAAWVDRMAELEDGECPNTGDPTTTAVRVRAVLRGMAKKHWTDNPLVVNHQPKEENTGE